MKEQEAPDKIVMTRKELEKWLHEKEQWWLMYGNPFEEARMVTYINRGFARLNQLKANEDTMIEMYPSQEDGELQFKVV